MSNPRIREYGHALRNPERYAIHISRVGTWHVCRGTEEIGAETPPATLAEAMDAAHADAEARAALVPTC